MKLDKRQSGKVSRLFSLLNPVLRLERKVGARFRQGPLFLFLPLLQLLLLVMLLLVSAPARTVQAQSAGQWSTPINLTTQLTDVAVPQIATDSQGKSYVVYVGTPPNNPVPTRVPTIAPTTVPVTPSPNSTPVPTPTVTPPKQYDLIYYQTLPANGASSGTNTGQNPSQPTAPTNIQATDYQGLPLISLAVDNKRGLLHMLFHSGSSIYYSYAPLDKAASAAVWSEPRNLDDYGNSYYSSLVVDGDGVIHAAWTQELAFSDAGKDLFQKVVYRQSSDLGKTWTFPKYVATQTFAATNLTLKIDAGKGLYLSWDEGYDNLTNQSKATYSAYTKSNDSGKTWAKSTLYGSADDPKVGTTMTLFGSSGVMLVWYGIAKQQLEFVVSNDAGGSWSAPASLGGLPQGTGNVSLNQTANSPDRLALTADGLGKVHLVAAGPLDGTASSPQTGTNTTTQPNTFYHSTWENNAWSTPESLGELTGYAGLPSLEVGPNELTLVWVSRANATSTTGRSVWYSTKPGDTGLTAQPANQYIAPTVAPTVNTTPAPGSDKATLGPILQPVTLPPGADQQESNRLWFDTGYSVAFISLIPVIGLGAILTFITWSRRRNRR